MEKFRLLLALIVANLCSVQGAWAERVAPINPDIPSKTLESGQSYYLYNPSGDKFVAPSGGNVIVDPNLRALLTIAKVENKNYYTIKFADEENQYFASYDNWVHGWGYDYYSVFYITAIENGYRMSRVSSYEAGKYVGYSDSDNRLYHYASGHIDWRLYDEDDANAVVLYRAKKALYDALVAAEGYDFAIEEYETLYADDNATAEELSAAAEIINKGLLQMSVLVKSDTEYPIYMEPTGIATWNSTKSTIANGEGGLKAVIEVDQDATLVYDYALDGYGNNFSFDIYVDGSLYQSINNYEGYNDYVKISNAERQRFFVELTAGHHVIEWKGTSESTTATNFWLQNIAAYKTPTITVNLTLAGSLGTEVLYQVDHVKDVRKLVVKGKMNSDDWDRINMMTGLFALDLSETNVTTMPKLTYGEFFHKIALPSGLKAIEASAFEKICLDEITFPQTLTSIGEKAFQYTRIKEAVLPETISGIGVNAFAYNQSLTKVVWPAQATTVPKACFYWDYMISDFTLPEGITILMDDAFARNYNCAYQLPSTVKTMWQRVFEDCDQIERLIIPANCFVGSDAFKNCSKLKYVEIGEGCSLMINGGYYTFNGCNRLEEITFPTTFYRIGAKNMLNGCTALKKVTFKSPTVIDGDYYSNFFDGLGTGMTIYVPSYLVRNYKLDSYWYNYNIEGFSTDDVTDWKIQNPLIFYSQDRFGGTPNVDITTSGSWYITGEMAQNIGNFQTNYSSSQNNSGTDGAGMVLSACDNVTISGTYKHDFYAYNRIAGGWTGRWHFVCLPFDIKVSDITCDNNARLAIRYYDGANRAANGTGNSWKDYDSNATITAGTGFIMRANKECLVRFTALNNAAKQNVVSNKIFTKALDTNASEQSADKGWNLVGNPWMCYYNIHKLNFTGPITVYDGYNKKYEAYSVIDDDYAILPNQAFFVQCPDEVSAISFPVDGRQLTAEIESQNAARADQPSMRKLIDVEISNGELNDKTRFVLNPQAMTGYETSRDASKFLEAGTLCPQIYTIEQGERLAINERPLAEGVVLMGFSIPNDDTYTISAPRNQFQNIVLVDNETGLSTDLSNSGSYTFNANAGIHDNRFELHVSGVVVTAAESIAAPRQQAEQPVYNLNGQRIAAPAKGLYIMNGKKMLK